MQRVEIGYADSDGVEIAYRTVGEGERDLVFVPGFVSHVEILWEHPLSARMLERLSSFARVILWDKREQGLSDRTGAPPTLEQSKDDLGAVIDAAGSERATILGVSEGGPMAILFAASHPDRVDSLALLNTYARLTSAEDYPHGVEADQLAAGIEMLADGWGSARSAQVFAPSRAENPEFLEWWGRAMRSGASPRSARALLELYLELDVRDVLDAVHAPALVLHRLDDSLISADQGRYLAERLPDARFVGLEGGDHLFFLGGTEKLIEEVEELVTGRRSARAPERKLTTIVFTDIVGSTRTAAEVGDRRWRELLGAHNELTRRELSRHGGLEVKATGDGFLASFDGPARAVHCARELVERTAEAGIPIRAGVHTGECEVLDDDLGGLAVHIGARVGALAAEGEVLVTGTVRDLVVGSELRFEERGEEELSGVPGPWRLFSVVS